jgi:phosphoserine phosphatase
MARDFVLNVIGRDCTRVAGGRDVVWLKRGFAFDMPFDGEPSAAFKAAHEAAGDTPLDINIVATAHRRKKLLVADMDSTIINCECLDEIADMMELRREVSSITERAMRGEIEFAPALRERVALLKGTPLHRLSRVYAERVRLNPGARKLIATMKANGARAVLVSGGFTYFTSRVAADAGFDADHANELLDDGGRLTGEVREPILGREAKLKTLEDAVSEMGIEFADALAVGDGANDLDMIGRAGLGVAYHAKPIVAANAGARIDHNDLSALLFLQGYQEHEFASV